MTTRLRFTPVLGRLVRARRGPSLAWRPGWWRRFLALTRLSLRAVCEESAEMGCHDYHTRTDDAGNATADTVGRGRCRRCGKWFRL